jgi:Ca-activated chloride channel family protein
MLQWAQPGWLVLIVPIALYALWAARRSGSEQMEGSHVLLSHPNLSPLPDDEAVSPIFGRWQLVLNLLASILLVIALAQPQRLGNWIPETPEGREIVLLIDTSKTMSIGDFAWKGQSIERMGVLKDIVSRFVEARAGDRFGVIGFGSFAATLVPPTFDRDLVSAMIQRVQVGVAGDDTAIGDAIGLALKQLREQPRRRPALILFTDGDNTAGEMRPAESVELARHMGVPIYSVQIGSDPFEAGRQKQPHGHPTEPSLREMAALTGGKYYVAGSGDALQSVINDIGQLEKTVSRPASHRVVEELYLWPLLLAAALLVLARVLQIRRSVS